MLQRTFGWLSQAYIFAHLSQVARNLNNFPIMFALMRVARSLLQNEHLHIEPYVSLLFQSFRSTRTNAHMLVVYFPPILFFKMFFSYTS